MRYAKKMLAPLIITILAVLQAASLLAIWLMSTAGAAVKILLTALSLCLVGALIYVLAERIQEIRNGEEDDLSNY